MQTADHQWRGLVLGRRQRAATSPIGFSGASKHRTELDSLITYEGDGHIITFAPTGTGKTSGPVICNALTHPGQLIVLDIKGEVYRHTAAARRAMGQEVHVLDLRDGGDTKGSLNPLDLAARSGTDVAAIARGFAGEMVEPGSLSELFWINWCQTMIASGVAWLLADCPPEERQISRLYDLFTSDDAVYSIAVLLDTKKVKERAAYRGFASFLQLPEKETRPSVLGTVQAELRLFDSDLIRRVTDTTSFDIDALIAGKPMSLYIIVPPHRLVAFRPLLRLWLSGLLLTLTQREGPPEHRTLMLCDEIGNVGKIEAFLMASTLMRGYGLTLWSFFQNAAQLKIYGDQANTLIDNAGVLQLFGARNRRMAGEFAAMVGGIDADAVMKLGPGQQILLVEGGEPIVCRQTRWYQDAAFTAMHDEPEMAR